LPHTDFSVRVDRSVKGNISVGTKVTVTLAGGITDTGPVTVDGTPNLLTGAQYLFFLTPASAGKYYPLAGGAAVASASSSGQFVLSSDVTGSAPQAVDLSDLILPPHSVKLVVTDHPALNVDGIVESGGITRTVTSTGYSLSGDTLIDGTEIHADLSVTTGSVGGFFSVNGVQFTVVSGKAVGGRNASHFTGKVSVQGAAPRYTTAFNLDITTQ
jgi:hypothetical protein